ncbi:MAG: hypothetical protein JXA75_07030, partial [Candidatus Thermoplasmatota archaeon]|nr:hypothetical protein [Candidatus Thermoplasmatota archaeon]
EDKRLNVHIKHEMLNDATVQGIDNVDGRFGSLISLKSRSATVDLLNFGQIYPYLSFYSENGNIKEYQMNQNPATKEREWIISYKDDATLGTEAWLCYGEGEIGKANAVIFATSEGIVTSGTDERDGIQLKVAEKEYFNFLGTEVDYVSINFGRHSYTAGYSHDVTIPSDLIVSFDAEVFASDTRGYTAVQKESQLYQTLAKSRRQSGDIPFEREQKRYNITIISRFGGTHFSYPRVANITGQPLPVMWIELYHDGKLIDAGIANRTFFFRARKTFTNILEGDYLIKVFWKRGNISKVFTGATVLRLERNTKVTVFCTWERTITFTFLDQQGKGIPGIHGWLTNKEGIRFDDNTTQENGELRVRAPYNLKDPYTLHAQYKDFIIYDEILKRSIRKINEIVTLDLYSFDVFVTDMDNLPPGVEITPILTTLKENKTIQLTPSQIGRGHYVFEGIPAGEYILLLTYGDVRDELRVTVPDTDGIVEMRFTAVYELIIDLYNAKGNALNDDDIEFNILRDGQNVLTSNQRTFTLPPAHYTIQAHTKQNLIGEKDIELTNNRRVTFVTTLVSSLPTIFSIFWIGVFGFFLVLTIIKKFSISSLLKCLAILLILLSFFQPWWQFYGSSISPLAEMNTAMYVNPGVMIRTTIYEGKTSLNIAEMPDIFLMFLSAIIPLAILACLSLVVGIAFKKIKKQQYAFLLYISGVILLCVLLPSFYFGTLKLTEASIGSIQGQDAITISIASEEILMQSSWGLSYGFYFVLIATIIAVSVLIYDIRTKLKKKS